MDQAKINTTANSMEESVSRSINVDCAVRPRETVNGGTKQLKLQNRTKGRAPWDLTKRRAFKRVIQRIGALQQARIQKTWKNLQESKGIKNEKAIRWVME